MSKTAPITIPKAAIELGCHPETLRRYVHTGKLVPIRVRNYYLLARSEIAKARKLIAENADHRVKAVRA